MMYYFQRFNSEKPQRKTRPCFCPMASVIIISTLLAALVCVSNAQHDLQPRLTASENSITLRFSPNPSATNYTASSRISSGFIFNDIALEPPYNSSDLTATFEDAVPGIRYTVELYENVTQRSNIVFQQEIAAVPLRPEDVRVTSRGNTFLVIQWNSTHGHIYEKHEISYTQGNGDFQMVTSLSGLTYYNLTNLEPGYNYDINVVAVTLNSRSQRSNSVVAATIPLAPIQLLVSALGSSQLNVTWQTNSSSQQQSFVVKYALSESETELTAPCTDSPCVLSPQDVKPGQGVMIYVYSISHSQMSAPSAIEHSTAPGKVVGFEATEGVASLQLQWRAPEDSFQESYLIIVSSVVDQVSERFTVPANTTNFTISSLKGGYIFNVEIHAQTNYELGEASSKILRTLPEPVSNLTGSPVNTTAVQLSWINPTNSEITHINISVYKIDGEVVSQERIEDPDQTDTMVISGLSPGVEYSVGVRVVSKYTDDSQETITVVRPKPVVPALTSVMSEETEITIMLALSEERGMFESIQAMIQGSIVQHRAGINGLVSFSNLTPGTAYAIDAFTLSGNQTSRSGEVSSDVISFTLYTRPRPPVDLNVVSTGERSMLVSWDEPDLGGYDNFTVTVTEEDSITSPRTILTSELEMAFDDLQPGTTYNISVSSVKGDQYSLSVWEFNTTNPESVAALQKVEALTDSITVNWTAPTSVNIDFFQLGIKAQDPTTRPEKVPMMVPKSVTNITFSDLEPGLEYVIAIRTGRVRGVNQRPLFGVSVKMNAVTKPLPVDSLSVETINTTTMRVTWDTNLTSRQDKFRVIYTTEGASKTLTLPARNNTADNYTLDVDQLLAGYTYSVSVISIRAIETDLTESEPSLAIGYTDPLQVTNVTLAQDGSDLRVTWVPPASGKWKSYKIMYRAILLNNDSEFLLRTATQEDTTVRLTDLFPGENYEVKVISVSNDIDSLPQMTSAVTKPLPPINFETVKDQTTTTSLTVSWAYDKANTYTEHWSLTFWSGQDSSSTMVETSSKQVEYRHTYDNLVPGLMYRVEIAAVVHNQESNILFTEVTTKPEMNCDLTPGPSTNSSISLSYTVRLDDVFDHIQFVVLNHPSFDQVMKPKMDLKRVVTFNDLEAGTKYTVRAVTVSNGVTSPTKTLDLMTKPSAVTVTPSSTSSAITLTLGPQIGGSKDYIITCTVGRMDESGGPSCGQRNIEAASSFGGDATFEVVFEGLQPFQYYKFVVRTRTGILRGEQKEVAKSYEYRTSEDAPSVVRSLRVEAQSIHSVSLAWQAPANANGVLRSYTIGYIGNEPNDPQERDMRIIKDVPVSTLSRQVDNLRAGFEYKFSVYAMTIAQGEAAERGITMGTAAPAFKPNLDAQTAKPSPLEASSGNNEAITETKISLTFKNPFSNENGVIRYYTVVVSKDPRVPDSSTVLPSWSEAQKDSSIKVYQALGQCTDFFNSSSTCGKGSNSAASASRRKRAVGTLNTRVFVVGYEENCDGKDFCNGGLSSDTDYYVKLRGFTASGEYKDTAYSEKIRTAQGSKSKGGMIGGVVAVIAAVVVVIVVIVVMRRRRRPMRATKHVAPNTTWEQSNMCKFSRPVKLADFPTHVRKMAADSDFKYAEEYEDLKEVGRDQPCLAAEFPPNRPKNRFTNILPYDHSRVKLLPTDDEEGSDYINANYMPGYNSKREYIATQGPLPATRDDFWRLLWEQSTRNIVMLTRCQEKGREKSDHYWPSDSDPKFYGDLQIIILNETHMPDWTVTEFKVSLGEQSRNVRHFHYRVWPDFGVPKNPTSIIRFVRMVREKLIKEGGGPIITHCSAGVGRSGTFIVLDHLLQMIREQDEVDIFSIVYKLRKERVLMVQTEQQYKFIHECLLCVLEGKEDDTTYANVGQINVGFEVSSLMNEQIALRRPDAS